MKKKMFTVLLAAMLVVSFGACSSTESSSSPESSTPSVSTAESESSSEAEATPEPVSSAPESSAVDEASAIAMNTPAALGDWEITVTGMEFMTSVSTSEYTAFNPDEGNQYLMVSVSVTNNGKEADTFLPSLSLGDDVSAKVMYGDGYEFSATNLLAYDREMHDATLNPLSSKEGDIAFEVPQSVVDSADPLTIVFSAGSDQVEVTLR